MNVSTLGLLLHIRLTLLATETGRVSYPCAALDIEIQANKVTGSRANREATTDRHDDGLLI